MRHIILLTLFVLPLACVDRTTGVETSKPNILLIFADDLTYRAVQSLGNRIIQTPNIDRIARGGTTFSHAYNMGGWNGAICTASRSMMISGRSLWRANTFKEFWRKGEEMDKTWGKLMESAGYNTYMTGKWHVAAPADQVFQKATHIRPGMPPDTWPAAKVGQKLRDLATGKYRSLREIMPVGYHRPNNELDHSWSPTDTSRGGFWQGGKHWSEVVAEDALSFLDHAKGQDDPFMMYVAFNAPHDPRQAPQSYIDRYPIGEVELPVNFQALHPFADSMGCGPGLRDEALAPFPRTAYAVKKHVQEYYAIISHLDDQIGRILDALESSGKVENTYVFFTADHGLAVGRHGLLGKQNMYEHSIRVPLLVQGPNVPSGQVLEADVYLQDIMATALDVASIEKPEYVEFNSLIPLIEGAQTVSNYDAIYGAYIDWQRMIRKDHHKLIVYPRAGEIELFDLESDPEELNNLAENPTHAEKRKALLAELKSLQSHFDDALKL